MIVGTGLWPELPLVVGANRDERLDRPAEPPSVRQHEGVRLLAPRDARAGGTWLGVNEHRVFVAITNRFGPPPDPTRRSRGEVVLSALTATSADEAFNATLRMDPRQFNGFHLVLADRDTAHAVVCQTDTMEGESLAPGWHVVTERSFDAGATRREGLIRATIEGWSSAPPSDQEWVRLLSLEQPDGFEGVLVSVPAENYGTRSSTIIRMGRSGEMAFTHADGRPDQTPFVDYSGEARFE